MEDIDEEEVLPENLTSESTILEIVSDESEFPFSFGEIKQTRRIECDRCDRPARVCLCSVLPPTPFSFPQFTIIVLEHEEEAKMNKLKRTVPLLFHIFENIVRIKGRRFLRGRYPQLDLAIADPNTILLFPTDEARDIRSISLPSSQSSTSQNFPYQRHLIVLDATWASARKMYAKSECLHSLATVILPGYDPHNSLNPDSCWSRPLFTVRKEPSEIQGRGGRSTAEAIAACLLFLPEHLALSGEDFRAVSVAATKVMEVVNFANGLQLSCIKPEDVRHRPNHAGYIPDLYKLQCTHFDQPPK